MSDLCRRNYIGVIAVILAFAEEVSSGAVPKSCQVDPSSPQLCWRLQRRCQCERSVSPQIYWRLQRRCQCE